MTVAVVALRIAGARHVTLTPIIAIAVLIPLALAFWGYLIASFAAAHRIGVAHAGILFGLTIALLTWMGDLLRKLFSASP